MTNSFTITKIKFGVYNVTYGSHKANIHYYRSGRYDTFDGKYKPAWVVICNHQSITCTDKNSAIATAKRLLSEITA